MNIENMIISDSVIGNLGFCFSKSDVVSEIVFIKDDSPCCGQENHLIKTIKSYCKEAKTDLSKINYSRQGTAHQMAVWDFLLTIPKGQTRTYTEVSQAVGGSPRSVANALRRNPLPILFPCHRVVAKSGLGGFSGETKGAMMAIKQHFLAIEAIK